MITTGTRTAAANNKRIPQFFPYQVGKSTAPVHLAVCQEIGAAGYLFLYSQKNGLHNILDVDKRQILPAEAH